MTDPKGLSTKEQSARRQARRVARRELEEKLGRKLKDNEQADHKKASVNNGKKYNNDKGNLQAVTTSEHKKKNKRDGTGGRPKGSKDTAPREKK
jgi:hypothetical protein